ncbi:phage protein Gp27 family protein [Blastochloris tepida]|uniref:Uncharacterized protein n=1 Tax=Blastochloris tepida TaxID=2233851 RepID=A0A348FYI8_9HYPH|nr:phage protein Gp27 family protein [Blastochloris tepida]BBF92371.1 hypothetical protein BLTE_10560 [Blastochloris tepida]
MVEGRGRLSSIEMLPDEFTDIVVWANAELQARKRAAKDICAEFNERLQARSREIGVPVQPIAASTFNRYSIAQAQLLRDLDETTRYAAAIADRMGAAETDELTIAVAESIKAAVFRHLRRLDQDDVTAKELKAAAEALRAAVTSQKASTERRRKLDEAFEQKTERVLEVAREGGLSADAIAQLRREFLGIRPKETGDADAAGS